MNITLILAWRNLWRHPRRTWLTIGAMVFSNAILVFMISLQFGMYELMINNTLRAFTGHLQVQAPGYIDDHKIREVVPVANELAEKLREELGLQTIAVRSAAFALLSSDERSYGVQIVGVDPASEPRISSIPGLIEQGRFFYDSGAQEIALGSVLARNLKVDLGDEITLLGSARDGSFAAAVATIVGIFESGLTEFDRQIAEVPLGFFDEVFFMDGAAHEIVIMTPGLSLVDEYALRTAALLPPDGRLVVHDWNALQPGLRQAIQADMSSAFFMYGVLIVLVAFSVMNTQLMSVLERTHEFGVVMSLGLTPGRLSRLVLIETSLMGLGGLLLGAAAGALVTLWFTFNGFSYPGMDEMAATFNLPSRFYPHVTGLSVFLGPTVVYLGSLLAALYPAMRLLWLQPVEAMRST